jgi:hypothetical protein
VHKVYFKPKWYDSMQRTIIYFEILKQKENEIQIITNKLNIMNLIL